MVVVMVVVVVVAVVRAVVGETGGSAVVTGAKYHDVSFYHFMIR